MTTPVDLPALATKISELGEQVKTLKSASSPDKDAIAKAVKELLDAKKLYADNNDGIGVDGKKFEAPLSKAEKKKKAKAEKAAAAAAAGGGGDGDGKDAANPNSANAQKKAAKKAEAKAKKAAMKAAAASGNAPPPPPAKTPQQQQPPTKSKPTTNNKPTPSPKTPTTTCSPMELKFNPNVPLPLRPITTLTILTLLDTAADMTLTSDHKCQTPTLGLPDDGGTIGGDFAIARYLLRTTPTTRLYGTSPAKTAEIDQWVDYATSLSRLPSAARERSVHKTLDCHLGSSRTYIVGHELTLADIAIFSALDYPTQSPPASASSPTERWIGMLCRHPAFRVATQLAMNIALNNEITFSEELPKLHEGMVYLEGAIPFNTTTRFPPEPSGYLHIGHAKAALLNDYYARRYGGRLIVRFDDTNPSKEKEEYQESIVSDLETLRVSPTEVTFTSDYFGAIRGYALRLIDEGLAFMDDTPQEQMQKERMERVDSVRRGQSVEECLKLFKMMESGSEEGGKFCLRLKGDMKSDNGTMRDPVIYRQNLTPHHRTSSTYHAYPTYDLACPIVDSIEGVTHALRTTEYNDRDEQFAYIQKLLNLRRTRIHAFSRMNFMYTELSKRKLAWFVDNGIVGGWDDARFPTIRGVVRRGVNVEALRGFICSQGASRRVTNMEWNKFWAENKKEIDKTAKRFMAIDKTEFVTLTVVNAPSEEEVAYVTTDYLPKDKSAGVRVVRLAREVMLEKGDVEGCVEVGEDIVLMRWGVVKITKIISPSHLEGTYLPDGDFKAAKKKLSWLAKLSPTTSQPPHNTPCTLYEFDNLISKEKLDEGDDFKDFLNPHTMACSEVLGDAGLKTLQKGDVIQLERRGYFRVDRPYISEGKGVVLYMVPDGKSRPMGGLTGKLAHR